MSTKPQFLRDVFQVGSFCFGLIVLNCTRKEDEVANKKLCKKLDAIHKKLDDIKLSIINIKILKHSNGLYIRLAEGINTRTDLIQLAVRVIQLALLAKVPVIASRSRNISIKASKLGMKESLKASGLICAGMIVVYI